MLARIYTIEHDYERTIEILEIFEETYGYRRLVAIYMKLNEEEKLFNLYKKYYSNNEVLDKKLGYDENDRRLKLYLETKFNRSFKVDFDDLSYYEKQICNYDEARAIDHIKRHHCEEFFEKSRFCEEIDIVDLFNKVKQNILNNSEKGILGKSAGEIYYFNYQRCGLRREKERLIYTNTFRVCTLIGTNKIISMYPSKEVNDYQLCYLEEQNTKSKTKVKTGIERFNSKYGNIK